MKKIFLLAFVILLIIPISNAAITSVNSSENYFGTLLSPTSTLYWELNTGTLTNGLLVSGFAFNGAGDILDFNVSYDGVRMKLVNKTEVGTREIRVFYLESPSNSLNNITIKWSSVGGVQLLYLYGISSWYDGVSQVNTIDKNVSGFASTAPALNITPSENNELIFSMYSSEENNVLTVDVPSGDGETLINDYDEGARVFGASHIIQATAGQQTMDFGGQGDDEDWIMGAVSFRELATVSGNDSINITLISPSNNTITSAQSQSLTYYTNVSHYSGLFINGTLNQTQSATSGNNVYSYTIGINQTISWQINNSEFFIITNNYTATSTTSEQINQTDIVDITSCPLTTNYGIFLYSFMFIIYAGCLFISYKLKVGLIGVLASMFMIFFNLPIFICNVLIGLFMFSMASYIGVIYVRKGMNANW